MTEDTKRSEAFRRLERRPAFRGRVIDVFVDRIELPDGRTVTRDVVSHPGAVAILPRLASGEILLVKQARIPTGQSLWEIPAGTLEPGEAPLDCAKRELLEETGFSARVWNEVLTFFTTPGFSNERITLYFADDLKTVGRPDPDEITECRAFSADELIARIEAGTLADAKTILAILLHRSRTPE